MVEVQYSQCLFFLSLVHSESSFDTRVKEPLLLCSCSDHELVWKHVDWVLQRDEILGVKVLLFSRFTTE